MNANIGRIIDIVGAALVLGLILRWGPQFAQIVSTSGATATEFFRAVSLQGIQSPQER